jgi:hypothetical protein
MNSKLLLALVLVGGVALLALWLRRQGESAPTMTAPPPPPPMPGFDDEDDDVEFEADDAAAVTVDGLAFIGEEHGVSLVPTPDPAAPAPGPILPVEFLRPGDFSAARVARGAPGVDPWRLELLGPEGEYVSFGFAVEEAARAALDLLETRTVMRYVEDEGGRPLIPSSEQFEEARRRRDETERLLALGDAEGTEPLQ